MSRSLLLAVPLLAFSGSGCLLGAAISSVVFEDVIEQERVVPAFDRLHATDGLFVVVQPGASFVRVKATPSNMEAVETTVVDGTLVVSLRDDKGAPDSSLATVTVGTGSLKSVEADGSAAVNLVPDTDGTLNLEHILVVDDAELYADGLVDADSLRAEVSRSGRLVLCAQAEHIDASFVGDTYGEIRCGGTARLDVNADERSDVRVTVTSEVRGTVSGGSTLRVSGAPPVHEVTASGGGQVVFE